MCWTWLSLEDVLPGPRPALSLALAANMPSSNTWLQNTHCTENNRLIQDACIEDQTCPCHQPDRRRLLYCLCSRGPFTCDDRRDTEKTPCKQWDETTVWSIYGTRLSKHYVISLEDHPSVLSPDSRQPCIWLVGHRQSSTFSLSAPLTLREWPIKPSLCFGCTDIEYHRPVIHILQNKTIHENTKHNVWL